MNHEHLKIAAFDGSPRKNGNSTNILKAFLESAESRGAGISLYKTDQLDLKPCRGCLMCNVLKKCAIRGDSWPEIAEKIYEADVLAFATPIYFHHATSSLKKLLDRFRSFLNVRITRDGIIHKPHIVWNKKIFLFTAHGSSSDEDAQPLIEMFEFMTEVMGRGNSLQTVTAVRLAVSGQILFTREQLIELYKKLELPLELAAEDAERNRKYIMQAESMAESLFTG